MAIRLPRFDNPVESGFRFLQSGLLAWLFGAGWLLRLLLIPTASETYDVSVWYLLANDMLRGLGIYSSHTYAYPPLWAYTFLPLAKAFAFFIDPQGFGQNSDNLAASGILPGAIPPVVSPIFLIIIKIPLIIADLAGAYLTYKIVLEFANEKAAKATLLLWLLNPSIIWTSYAHGQFDIIPAVLTLASSYLLLKRHAFYTGIALGIAILYKLYPLLLLPLYLALLFRGGDTNRDRGKRFPRVLRFSAGICISVAIPVLLPASTGFVDSLAARGGLISSIGGFSPLALLNLPQLAPARNAVILNSQFVTWSLLALQFGLSIFVALRTAQTAGKGEITANLMGHIAILSMILVTSLLTNPQYLVWLIPFLIVFHGVDGSFFKRVWLLSIVGFLFNVLWLGPGYFFYPSAIYLGSPSLTYLTSINSAFAPFTLSSIATLQIMGFLGIISCLKPNFRFLHALTMSTTSKVRVPHSSLQGVFNTKGGASVGILSLLAMVFLLASASFVSVNPLATNGPSLTITSYTANQVSTITSAEASLRLTSGTYPAEIDTLLLPLEKTIHQPLLYIYYDPNYSPSLTDLRGWTGVLDHLPFELQQRNYPNTIARVNANELAQIIQSNSSAVVVIPSGVLPSTTNVLELKSFIENGGILFWIGDRIAYYSAKPNVPLEATSPENPGYGAQLQLFDGVVVSYNNTTIDRTAYDAGTFPTNLSRALNLNYPVTLVGASLPALSQLGGTVLGSINEKTNQTSIATIPLGSGKIVIFGGGVMNQYTTSGEIQIAEDIAQIMSGGVLDSTFEFAVQRQTVQPTQTVNATIGLYIDNPKQIIGILRISYSPNPNIHFFAVSVHPSQT